MKPNGTPAGNRVFRRGGRVMGRKITSNLYQRHDDSHPLRVCLLDGAAGVYDADALRLGGGDLEVGVAHARVKGRVLGVETVLLDAFADTPLRAALALVNGEVEDERQVGHQSA